MSNGTTGTGTGDARELAKEATLRLPHRRSPILVRVERGTVLVTQEGDLDDHVLEAGDEVVLPAGGLAVAWAFTEAAISVRGGREPPPAHAE